MQAKAACPGMPLGPRWMFGQAGDLAPRLPAIITAEQGGGGHAGIKDLGLARSSGFDVPNAFEFKAGFFRKGGILLGSGPTLTVVRRPNQLATEPGVISGSIN